MNLIAGTYYDPAVAVSEATTALLAMTALDTTNLRLTFVAPPSGRVFVRIRGGCIHGATTFPQILVGCLEVSPSSGTVRGRQPPQGGGFNGTAVASTQLPVAVEYIITGLTAGGSYTWDAAYGVEVTVASTGWKYGGPNNTTTNDAFGGISFEVWDPSPAYTPSNASPSGPTQTLHDKLNSLSSGGATAQEVWEYATRTLTALDEDSTTLDLDATIRAAVGLSAANLDTQLSGIQSDTNDIQTRLPAALVGGRMDASVGAMAANTVTASALAADAVTEIQTGLSTLDAAGVRSAVGLASANLDTQLSTIAGYIDTEVASILAAVDTEVAAIKAKTDSLNFTVAGKLDVNVLVVNGVTVGGAGTAANPWGPA